jgi:hypothetical protein
LKELRRDVALANAQQHDGPYEAMLEDVERKAIAYFDHEVNPATGLVRDNTDRDSPATVAGTGFALSAYTAAVERGYMARREAASRTRTALRFLWNAPQGDAADATGAHGFFCHFLDMATGRRVWKCELSTIDTAIALAGILSAAAYFDRNTPHEREIRSLGDDIYRRVDWRWALNAGRAVSMGWKPENGGRFLPYRWRGYTEALLLYVLGLGSPTHALPRDCYARWTATYRWVRAYGRDYVHAGPLFIHHLSHIWIDFRGIRDAYMRGKGIDYFENSRRATYVQRAYAVRNPRRFDWYGDTWWGVTASDGPGNATRTVHGTPRRFYGYHARGVPYGPDDGTLSPWAVAASLPFAPEIVLPTLQSMNATYPGPKRTYGYMCSINPSFRTSRGGPGWISPRDYAINQGPAGLMVENFRSGLIWRLMRSCPYVRAGLRRAGFTGGWLQVRGHEGT